MKSTYAKRVLKLILCSVAIAQHLGATDLRAPLPVLDGPMRFVAENDGRDESSVRIWSAVSMRQASRAFMDHGTATRELTDLIFNQADFRMSDAFSNSLVPLATEYYNPLLRTARMHTKAQYTETDVVFGAQWMYPVYEDRGRFGIRARVPFRRIEMERVDQSGVRGGAQLEDVRAIQPVGIADGTGGNSIAVQTEMMRMDFAEALIQSGDHNSAFDFAAKPKIGGKEVSAMTTQTESTAAQRVALVKSPEGQPPIIPNVPTNVATIKADPDALAPNTPLLPTSYVNLPGDGTADFNKVYVFEDTAALYAGLPDENATDVKTRRINQAKKETLWLIPFAYETNSLAQPAGVLNKTIKGVEYGSPMRILGDLSQQVTENVFEWLHDRGYDFESDIKAGLGDIDLECFYQQDLSGDISVEANAGVRIPINKEKQYFSNPYQVRLGNGGHWTVKSGASVAWHVLKNFNLRLHGFYAFVFPETEELCATYKGSLIKNIGPKIDTDVEWRYAAVNFDVTFLHPESDTFSALLGYQFYWKGQDKASFKSSKASTWLGRLFNKETLAFNSYEVDLDHTVLESNTDSVGHRMRLEASLRIGSYCELFAGGGYTFAGKHVARDVDTHFGVHLIF